MRTKPFTASISYRLQQVNRIYLINKHSFKVNGTIAEYTPQHILACHGSTMPHLAHINNQHYSFSYYISSEIHTNRKCRIPSSFLYTKTFNFR